MIRPRAFPWVLVLAVATASCGDDGTDVPPPPGAKCGPVDCRADEYCCDASCGLCIEQEVACVETCAEP
jgi:hypothetical protein